MLFYYHGTVEGGAIEDITCMDMDISYEVERRYKEFGDEIILLSY